MFSHLCRACLNQLAEPSDMVPLFEAHQNVVYSRICNTMQLSVDDELGLGRNVCKSCAENIMNFYNFRLMFMESERKLREMLVKTTDPSIDTGIDKTSTDYINFVDVEVSIEEDTIVQTSLETTESKWKCKKCSAGFKARSLLQEHTKRVHRINSTRGFKSVAKDESSIWSNDSNTDNEQKRWKCAQCSEHFRTRRMKYKHQKDCCQMNAATVRNETGINENDDDNDGDFSEFHFSNDADGNSSEQVEFKYDPKCEGDLTTDLLLVGLQMVEKREKIDDISGNANPMGVVDEKWKCKKCSQSFRTRDLLREHNFLHKKLPEVQTKIEGHPYKTENESGEDDNNVSISNKKESIDKVSIDSAHRWQCKTCLSIFQTRDLLRTHRKSHLVKREENSIGDSISPKPWSCVICLDTFPSRKILQTHRRVVHLNQRKPKSQEDGKEYVCEVCEKIFKSKIKIRSHMDTHKDKGRRQRLCTICGLRLCSTYNLNTHIRIVHGGERKFKCPHCERRFSYSQHLKTHINRHEGIRPFTCELCMRSFHDKSSLSSHNKSVHLNLKIYICQICSKAFNRNGNLRAHMVKTHHLGQPEMRMALQPPKIENITQLLDVK